jgi:hypothetical protein
MAINLSAMTLQRPAMQHGAVAAARIPFVQANDTAALAAAAQALGFKAVSANEFSHPDGSWLLMQNGRLERGHQQVHFRGVPMDLTQLPVLGVGQAVAAQQIAPTWSAGLAGQLTQAGFTESSKGFFAHPDGSWVALLPDQKVVRGRAQSQLDPADLAPGAQPARPARGGRRAAGAAQPAAQAPAQPAGMQADDVLKYQARAAQFEDGFLACAQLGFLQPQNLANDKRSFASQGFVEKAPNYFEHPDSSWVAYLSNGRIERGVGQTMFQRVPVSPQRAGSVAPPASSFTLAAADSKLQALTLAQVQKSDKPLTDAGFTKKSPNFYAHSDGSFLAFTSAQVYSGHNNQIFASPPVPIEKMTKVKSAPEHGWTAIAKTGDVKADTPQLAQKLGGLGFTAKVPGKMWEHPDGSFVVLHNNAIYRGVAGQLLSDVPKPPPPGTGGPDKSRPPLPNASNWAWWQQNTALGRVPLLSSAAQAQQVCPGLGFTLHGQEYWHADGSWVSMAGGRISLGWKGYKLGELPYNNRTSRV